MMSIQQLWSRFQAWRAELSLREQYMVLVMACLMVVMLIYWGIWTPLHSTMTQATTRFNDEQRLNVWITHKADMITQLRKSGPAQVAQNQPFNQVMATSTSQYHIQLSRIQPRGDSNQVWIEPVSFNRLLDWLDYLNHQHGLTVDALELERTDTPGVVSVDRLILR